MGTRRIYSPPLEASETGLHECRQFGDAALMRPRFRSAFGCWFVSPFEMDRLPLYFLAPLLPFFLAGMALIDYFSICIASESSSLYFYESGGCGAGSGPGDAFVAYIRWGRPALLVGATAPAVAALLISLSPTSTGECKSSGPRPHESFEAWRSSPSCITAGAAFSAVKFGALPGQTGRPKRCVTRWMPRRDQKLFSTGWNAYSRIDCVEGLAE
jgi:hypothetical protein